MACKKLGGVAHTELLGQHICYFHRGSPKHRFIMKLDRQRSSQPKKKNKSGNTSKSGKQLKRLLSKLSLRSALTLFLNNYNCKCQIARYIKINLLSMMLRQPKKMPKKLHNLGVELLLSIGYGALSSSHGQT